MSASSKEIQKKMLVNKTIASMEKQIQKLEEQKKVYIEAGKQAKQQGLTAQYNLALSGLRMTTLQQRRVYEMKLNFEITRQMKDMSQMTGEFLKGMSSLSKDMLKLTKEKEFLKVEKEFNEAMVGVEMQTQQMESFMDETQSTFASGSTMSASDTAELEAMLGNVSAMDAGSSDLSSSIDAELEELKRKMNG